MSFCHGCTTCPQLPGCTRASRAGLVDRKFRNWFGYLGTVLFMVGAFAVSASTTWSGHPAPFAVFLAGHILWFGMGYLTHERPLLVLNGLYIGLDLWALWVRL